VADQETPQRPPASGPGSGVTAWREYAAVVTGSPVESWAALTREEIVQLLDSEGTDPNEPAELTETEQEADRNAATARAELNARPQPRPVWMTPTEDGWVPEHELIQRTR
jgi:hypothetical protein